MQFLLLIYTDDEMLEALPDGEFDARMNHCFRNADEMREQGTLIDSQQLEAASSARSVRFRNGKLSVVDGPFAETKELLGGFNLIEAADYEEAVRIAASFPWTQTGGVEVRAVRDMGAVRRGGGAVVPAR